MTQTPKQFMMDFGLKLIRPSTKETWMDGLVMAFSYSRACATRKILRICLLILGLRSPATDNSLLCLQGYQPCAIHLDRDHGYSSGCIRVW
jgi:hypothetical protein